MTGGLKRGFERHVWIMMSNDNIPFAILLILEKYNFKIHFQHSMRP